MSSNVVRSKRPKCFGRIFDTFLFSTAISKASENCLAIQWWTAAIGLIISHMGVVYPQNTYIRCDDPYISKEAKNDSITVAWLLSASLIVPFITMLIFEWVNLRNLSIPKPFFRGLKKAFSLLITLFVGNLFSFFIVEVLKTAVSEPRPNFMNTCSPNLTKEICQDQWVHVTWENCSNPLNLPHRKLIDSMKSFPSGHASVSVFSAVFTSMYIQERVKVPWSKLLSPWLHLALWVWTLLCCTSRIWDNKHHWWDVVFGGMLGAIASYATVKCLCNTFKNRPKKKSSIDEYSKEKEDGSSNDDKNYYSKPDSEGTETCSHHTSTEPIVKRTFEE